ncbi:MULTISPECIES: NucA/NucB deoxyribonuclease domain-containing protein [unclassified Streptomyces]|uniref:NucA/NucB deoxyribonuclease domain-containing protein n=1 Tax=unclassified Streptomyces TaxID=2593676 RepID=UPI00278BB85F|nr:MULTISPECIES: NucA/NucB deoxyribonuclease domain-containing protein [unclassified Streptomyces]
MSHPIAKALEDAAQRMGRKLSKDAAKAVGDMYSQVGDGTKKVVKNIQDADGQHAHELISLANKVAKNGGETGKGSRRRMREQAAARADFNQRTGGSSEYDAELVLDRNKYPESADHIEDAQNGTIWRGDDSDTGTPKPSVLTIDRGGADDNRADSLRGIPSDAPRDRDEYPPAMYKEGGAGASVQYIAAKDNQGSGSAMGSAVRGLPDGTRVKITVR